MVIPMKAPSAKDMDLREIQGGIADLKVNSMWLKEESEGCMLASSLHSQVDLSIPSSWHFIWHRADA